MGERGLSINPTTKISLIKTLKLYSERKKRMAIKGRNPTASESRHMDKVSQLQIIIINIDV